MTTKLLAASGSPDRNQSISLGKQFCVINYLNDGPPIDNRSWWSLLSSIVVFQLFFLTVGMLISLLMKRVRSVTPLSMALAFGMYVVSAFGGMLGDDTIDLISPFTHFEPNAIITNGAYDIRW